MMSGPEQDPRPLSEVKQLDFSFLDCVPPEPPMEVESPRAPAAEATCGPAVSVPLPSAPVDDAHTEAKLTEQCRDWLLTLDFPGAAKLVQVQWNARLRSTAGYASYPAWRIELNPRLREFDGQIIRTLKHELAHLIAYHQAGRKRIEPHGPQWRNACALLGIPDEKACHTLPLPRRQVKRKLAYQCAHCGFVLHRVRRFTRPTACLTCCNRYTGGRFDTRFRFQLLAEPPPDPSS